MNQETFLQSIALVLGGGTIASLATGWFTRKKTNAEAESTLSSATMDFAKLLQEDIASLREVIDEAENKLAQMKKRNEDTKEKLAQAEIRIQELQEIVHLSRERDTKNIELMHKLAQALAHYAPNHPLVQVANGSK